MSGMVLRSLCHMGWQDFSWLLCRFSLPRNKHRLPTSLIVLTLPRHCQIPTLESGLWHFPSGLAVVHPGSLWGPSACQVVSKPSFKKLAAKKSHWSTSFPSTVGGPGKFLCRHFWVGIFFPSLYKTAASAQIQEMKKISPVWAGEGDITKSFSKEKSELQQKLSVFLQITSLELPQIKALPKPSCCYQTKFPSQFGVSLQYSFSSVFHSFWFCPKTTYLAHFLLYPWGNLARRSSSKRLYHMNQQRWGPKWVGKHKDHIEMVPVESFSHPCAPISTSVASRQRVQTQLWSPGVCIHILVTRLAQVTPLGKPERFFLPFPLLLRPAEGPPRATLEEENGRTWGRSPWGRSCVTRQLWNICRGLAK